MSKCNKDEFKEYRIYSNGMVWSHLNKKMLKSYIDKDGYLRIMLCSDGIRHIRGIHRLVAQKFVLNQFEKPCVNHKNGIKSDNRTSNLEWVTNQENTKHAILTGLIQDTKGVKNVSAKLAEIQVLKIRRLYSTRNFSQRELGRIFNVDHTTIGRIVKRETWNHI